MSPAAPLLIRLPAKALGKQQRTVQVHGALQRADSREEALSRWLQPGLALAILVICRMNHQKQMEEDLSLSSPLSNSASQINLL